MSGARRYASPPPWFEVLRRVVLVVGLGSAVVAAVWPVAGVYQVGFQDWARAYGERPIWHDEQQATAEEYRASVLAGREIAVAGPAWGAILRAAIELAHGGEVGQNLMARAAAGNLYFRAGEPPLADVRGVIGDGREVAYLAITTAAGTRHLVVTWLRPPWARHVAPALVLYPRRAFAPWFLLAALLVYALLPWPRFSAESIHYQRVRGAILPDVVGTLQFLPFFGLPFFVIAANQPTRELFAGDWAALTLIGWGMSLFGLAIFAAAAWYASFCVEPGREGLRVVTLRGATYLTWSEIAAVRELSYRPPRWLRWASAIVSLLSWRAAGPALLAASRSDPGIELIARDGRRVRLWLTALDGVDRLRAAILAAGVPVQPASEPATRGEPVRRAPP